MFETRALRAHTPHASCICTSFGYRCVNCTGAWYGVPLFLALEFAPVTVLYLIILVFQVSVSSAPMQCFIFYAQWIVVAFYLSMYDHNSLRHAIFTEKGQLRLDYYADYTCVVWCLQLSNTHSITAVILI